MYKLIARYLDTNKEWIVMEYKSKAGATNALKKCKELEANIREFYKQQPQLGVRGMVDYFIVK